MLDKTMTNQSASSFEKETTDSGKETTTSEYFGRLGIPPPSLRDMEEYERKACILDERMARIQIFNKEEGKATTTEQTKNGKEG